MALRSLSHAPVNRISYFSGILYILLSTSPLTGFLVKKPSWLHSILKITGNFFLGFFLYFLLTVFTADIIRLIIKYCFRIPWSGSRLFFVLAGSICALIILFFCIYGISHVSHIKTKYYNIQIKKFVPDMKSLKIILVADFHFGFSTDFRHTKKIIQEINKEHADLVCIAGDTFDNDFDSIVNPERLQTLLKTIESRYGVYACWGNHDLNEPILAGFTFHSSSEKLEDPRMEKFFENSCIRLLNDQSELIDQKFYLIGREDPQRAEKLGIKRKTPIQLTKSWTGGNRLLFLTISQKS